MKDMTRYIYPLVNGVTNEKVNRIHPLMQRDVQTILEIAEKYPVRLVIFGSSLTINCHSESDIDLAVATKNKSVFKEFLSAVKDVIYTPIDFIYMNELTKGGVLWNEIETTGYLLK